MPVSDSSSPAKMRRSVVFPAPLRPRITTREPLSITQLTSVKISSEPYDLESSSPDNGVLPHGAGVGKRSLATLSETRTSSRPERSFSARRNMPWAAVALDALARIFSPCFCRISARFSALARSFLRRCSSCSRCNKYAFQPKL